MIQVRSQITFPVIHGIKCHVLLYIICLHLFFIFLGCRVLFQPKPTHTLLQAGGDLILNLNVWKLKI